MQRDQRPRRSEMLNEIDAARHDPLERVLTEQIDPGRDQRREYIDEHRTPARRSAVPAPYAPRRLPLRQQVRQSFSSSSGLRQAIALGEILGPPAALRHREDA